MSSTERYEDDIKRAILLYKIAKQNGSMEATRVGFSLNFKYIYIRYLHLMISYFRVTSILKRPCITYPFSLQMIVPIFLSYLNLDHRTGKLNGKKLSRLGTLALRLQFSLER